MDLAELLALPDVEEICVLRSSVGFLALHGGSQDRGTHEIASQAAAVRCFVLRHRPAPEPTGPPHLAAT